MNDDNVSRRRNADAVVGFVNFPTDTIKSSGEGGCFVRLVVIDTKGDNKYMNRWIPCCGGYSNFFMNECFLGDDLTIRHYPDDDDDQSAWGIRARKLSECTSKYLPDLKESFDITSDSYMQYVSRSFLCVMNIGATGWSSSEWVCTFDDLTADGKVLVESLRKLYDGCEIRLLTFLDT